MKKILVVDDQPCIRNLLADELSEEGYQMEGRDNAESALESLNATPPSLVILDLCLEEMDGFQLFQEIKTHHPLLPVIIFTAYDSYRDDGRLASANGYVIKSWDLKKLKREIAKVIQPVPVATSRTTCAPANPQILSA